MAGTAANVVRAAVDSCTINSVDVGFTFEPYVLTVNTETEDITVEQLLTPIRSVFVSRTVEGTITFDEASLATMAIAFGMPASNISGGSTLSINNNELGQVSCVIVGKAGSGNSTTLKKTFSFPQTVVSGSTSYNVAKLENSQLPVTLSHLSDSNGAVGTIIHHT